MTGVSVILDLDDELVTGRLLEAERRAGDLKPAMTSIARGGVASTRRRFQSGRGPDGAPWKKGQKKTGQTLIASTLLLRSITDQPPTETSVEWGSNRAYAAVHQDGFDGQVQVRAHSRVVRSIFGRRVNQPVTQQVSAHERHMKMPARPYLGISADDRLQFTAILARHVAAPLTGGGQ